MTNKEAIEILKPLFDQCKGTDNCIGYIEHYFSKDEEKALDLAIKALEDRTQNEKLINEYISKVEFCDECFASVYCTVNGLRKSRVPQEYCVKNIKRYFDEK